MIGVPAREGTHPPLTLRSVWSESLAYWEPRRLIYNGILLAVVITELSMFSLWPALANFRALAGLVVACGGANLCYCSAYAVDLALQFSDFRHLWMSLRGGLFLLGCILGAALAALTLPLFLQGLL